MKSDVIALKNKTRTQTSLKRNIAQEVMGKVMECVFFLCAFFGVVSVLAILVFVFYKGLTPFSVKTPIPFSTLFLVQNGLQAKIHMGFFI